MKPQHIIAVAGATAGIMLIQSTHHDHGEPHIEQERYISRYPGTSPGVVIVASGVTMNDGR
jgi:hypothetical protein